MADLKKLAEDVEEYIPEHAKAIEAEVERAAEPVLDEAVQAAREAYARMWPLDSIEKR